MTSLPEPNPFATTEAPTRRSGAGLGIAAVATGAASGPAILGGAVAAAAALAGETDVAVGAAVVAAIGGLACGAVGVAVGALRWAALRRDGWSGAWAGAVLTGATHAAVVGLAVGGSVVWNLVVDALTEGDDVQKGLLLIGAALASALGVGALGLFGVPVGAALGDRAARDDAAPAPSAAPAAEPDRALATSTFAILGALAGAALVLLPATSGVAVSLDRIVVVGALDGLVAGLAGAFAWPAARTAGVRPGLAGVLCGAGAAAVGAVATTTALAPDELTDATMPLVLGVVAAAACLPGAVVGAATGWFLGSREALAGR